MRFDLIDLRLILHVADAASITHGASRANMALPSASARIRGMENTLGMPLLERGRRGVRLTPAGQALVHHARIVLQQVERMRGDLGEYARGMKGHVRLLSNTAALTEFLPETLGAFLLDHSNVDVEIEERPSYAIVQAIAEGQGEVGIVADTVDLGELETFPFRTDRLVLVTARTHRLATQRTVSFAEVLDEPFVGLGEASALQEYLAQHASRFGRPPRYRVRLSSFDAVCRLVEQGVGVGVVPDAAARRCQRSMAIRRVRLNDAWALRHLTICIRRYSELPAHARLLVDRLRTAS